MRHMRFAPAITLAVWTLACSESPTQPVHEHELHVTLAMSDHISTLDPVAFTVTVTDEHDGSAITDFSSIQVEYELEGTGTWRAVELTKSQASYVGTYTFVTSGDYHFRVTGMRGSETQTRTIYELPAHVEVERAHETVGTNYRVEFETFPGHIHEGEAATVRFWIMEGDGAGGFNPAAGWSAAIECGNPDGTGEAHAVTGTNDGVYEVMHTFEGGGEAHMELRFTDAANVEWETDFHLHVAHGH